MGSDESHFSVSGGSEGQSHKTVHRPQPFWRERRAEAVSNRGPSAYQPNALPLDYTRSLWTALNMDLKSVGKETMQAKFSGREYSHSKPHRFPSPYLKEGCRKPVLGVWGILRAVCDTRPCPHYHTYTPSLPSLSPLHPHCIDTYVYLP